MVIFIITSGRKHWYVVGAYVLPNDLTMVHWITETIGCGPEGLGKLLVVNFNDCLENLRDQSEEQVATFLARHGLTDQARHSLPRQKYRKRGTGREECEGGGYLSRDGEKTS